MATINSERLITRQFFSPTADTKSPLIEALTGTIKGVRGANKDKILRDSITASLAGTATAEQRGIMFQASPEKALKVLEGAGAITAQGQEKLANTAFKIQNIQDPAQQTAAIQNVIQQIQSGGGDPSLWMNMLQGNPQQRNQELTGIQQAVLSVKERGEADVSQQKLGFEERRTAATERNIRSQISERGRPKVAAQTSIQKNLEAAGFIRGTPEYQAEVLKFIQKPVGTNITIGDSRSLEKATEGQLASAGFANRMANAGFDINKLEDEGFDPSNLTQKIGTTIPGGNFLLSEEGQLYEAAKTDFKTAILRKESGAAIGADEDEREDKKFFPQPGDGPKTIAAKRIRRARAIDNLIKQSKGIYSIQFQTPEDARQEAPDSIGTAKVTPIKIGRFTVTTSAGTSPSTTTGVTGPSSSTIRNALQAQVADLRRRQENERRRLAAGGQ